MDFQFRLDAQGISVRCSMEHQAVAHWFNAEVRSDFSLIQTALSHLNNLNSLQEVVLEGREYTLWINADEVMIRANNLDIESEQPLEQDFYYYDEESIAFCGKEDFEHFLQSALAFHQSH